MMDTPAFLRWIGGKSKIIKSLARFAPATFERYWEPFLGGGSMFFFLQPKSSVLSDSNQDLITCYKSVRNHPDELACQLEVHRANNSKTYYYAIREEYNLGGNQIDQAARFIYLNKACFNGIYRVNKQGLFNVPYGRKEHPKIPDQTTLRAASSILLKADLKHNSYENMLSDPNVKENDFVYLDPPYPPLNGTSNFTHYTEERFSPKDQERLSEISNELSKKKCKVMITNADLPIIRKLYKNWKLITLPVTRWVSADGTRRKVNELVIVNYDVLEERQNELF